MVLDDAGDVSIWADFVGSPKRKAGEPLEFLLLLAPYQHYKATARHGYSTQILYQHGFTLEQAYAIVSCTFLS